jgi:hypothetical protein
MEETKQTETIVSTENKSKTIEFSSVFIVTLYVYVSLIILSFLTYAILKGFGIDLLIKL